jgi:hypothetical protein
MANGCCSEGSGPEGVRGLRIVGARRPVLEVRRLDSKLGRCLEARGLLDSSESWGLSGFVMLDGWRVRARDPEGDS